MLKTRLGFARANSLRAVPIFQLIFAASLAVGIGTAGHALRHGPEAIALTQSLQTVATLAPIQSLATARANVASTVTPLINGKPESVNREVELEDGQTFAELLDDSGVASPDSLSAMNAVSKVYDLRHMQAGQNVALYFNRTAQQETFAGAVFQPEATEEVSVSRNAQGVFVANMKLIPVVRQRLAARAEIHSSLYEAGDRAGVPHAIMAALIRIYSHDVDFQRDIHPGDGFEILYDQPTTAQGKAVGEGDIIYAALNVAGKVRPIYRVTFSDKTSDYFDERGQSVRRAILRTPVAAAHITSGFGMRMHPLLGYTKMHKGVDFGATIGTPIFAAGNGVIEEIGFKNGYGRYILIRHNATLATAYAHMSRFGANMHQGSHVNQGEVIAYVGMSGRATGPHLHFEVHINGIQVNPMSVNLPTGRSLDGKLLADFKQGQSKIKQDFITLLTKDRAPTTVSNKTGLIQASASGPAFPKQVTSACGFHGGC